MEHLPRTLPAADVADGLRHLHGALHAALTSLWDLPADLDPVTKAQVFLPCRHGGMDYVAHSDTRCDAAYCSAAALTVVTPDAYEP